MKLSRLLIAVIALPVNLALAAPAEPPHQAERPAAPATPDSSIMQLQFESCVWLKEDSHAQTAPLATQRAPLQGQKVCTQVRLIPNGHAMPDLSKLQPVVGDTLPPSHEDDDAPTAI